MMTYLICFISDILFEVLDYALGCRVAVVAAVDVAGMIERVAVEVGIDVGAFILDCFKYRLRILPKLIFAGVAPAKVDTTDIGHTTDVCFGREEMV